MINKKYSVPRINAWLLLHQMHTSLMEYEEAEFKKFGLPKKQFYIIAAIKYLAPPVTPSDIAKWLDRNTNTITLMLDRMEKDGLVKKHRDLPDRRAFRLSLTAKSRQLFTRATIPFREVPNDVMSCLSDDELQVYIDLTQKLREKIYNTLELHEGTMELHSHRIDLMASVTQKGKSVTPINLELLLAKNTKRK